MLRDLEFKKKKKKKKSYCSRGYYSRVTVHRYCSRALFIGTVHGTVHRHCSQVTIHPDFFFFFLISWILNMATEELLTRIHGKLDEFDIRAKKLADSMESRFDAFGKILLDVRTSKKRGEKVSDGENYDSDDSYSSKEKSSKIDDHGITLDDFTGLGNPEEFLEWERQVEKISKYKGFDDRKRFKIATIRLTKNACLWFDNLKARRARYGKEKILT